MALTVCLSAFYVSLKHLWGRVGSTDGFFARKPALKGLTSAVRRERPTGRSSYSRRESFEPRLSCERTVCRPTRRVNMSVFCTDVLL